MVNVTGIKSLATRVDEAMQSNASVLPVQAHAALSKGNIVHVVLATGLTEAPGAADRLLFAAVALEDISSGEEGRVQIKGMVQALGGAAVTMGSQIDPQADMKFEALGTQTNGNGFGVALETGADATLSWINIK